MFALVNSPRNRIRRSGFKTRLETIVGRIEGCKTCRQCHRRGIRLRRTVPSHQPREKGEKRGG